MRNDRFCVNLSFLILGLDLAQVFLFIFELVTDRNIGTTILCQNIKLFFQALEGAVRSDDAPAKLDRLVGFGFNFILPSPKKLTPMHVAARAGNMTAISKLAAFGLDISAPGDSGMTPALLTHTSSRP